MKHLAGDYYVSKDKYQFIVSKKKIYKSGKMEGQERFVDISFHPTFDRVVDAIGDLCAAEYINGDLSRCRKLCKEMKQNCKEAYESLQV